MNFCQASAVDIMMDFERDCGAASAGSARVADARVADRAHGPCRNLPPLHSTVPAEVQRGVGGKEREARQGQDGKDQDGHKLHTEDQRGKGRGVLPTGRAVGATRAGSAAHCGADRRNRSHGTDSRCTCAAGRSGWGARLNLAANRGARVYGRHGACDQSA